MAAAFLPERIGRAAAEGDEGQVRSYLSDGGDVNCRSLFQSQLLHIAAREGQHGVVRLLLDSGADVNSLDYAGMRRTALHWACQQGHIHVVELLVEAGADTKAQGKAWSMLVQGQRCGKMIDTEAPFSQSPATLCRNDTLRLALERPPWSPGGHRQFPRRFRQATRLLLLMASGAEGGRASGAEPLPAGAGCEQGDSPQQPAGACSWRLPRDVVLSILPLLAYPISAWIHEGDFDAPRSILK